MTENLKVKLPDANLSQAEPPVTMQATSALR
jgi:hypothetical protein